MSIALSPFRGHPLLPSLLRMLHEQEREPGTPLQPQIAGSTILVRTLGLRVSDSAMFADAEPASNVQFHHRACGADADDDCFCA
jgi:hypothetical protein